MIPDAKHTWTSPTEFAATCRQGLSEAKKLLPIITAPIASRTVENTLVPFNEMVLQLRISGGIAGLMSEVHPQKELRDSARECEQDIDKFASALSLNQDLYKAFIDLDVADQDEDTKRFVAYTLRDFRRAGVDKDEATRNRIKQIDEELTKAGQAFSKNIVEDVRTVEVDPKQLKGLPDDYLANHPPGKNGKITITTDYPDYVPVASYAESTDLRRQLYIKFRARGDKNNEPVLKKILTLRAEKAAILGYKNWADYVTETKMIKSAINAENFIEKIAVASRQRSDKDYQELLERKKQTSPNATNVEAYEKSYIANLVRKEKYAFDPQEVRPYFSYERAEKGLLDVTSKIYGIEYRVPENVPLWHEDVKVFDVFQNNAKIGRIYLDMHPRDGKYKHAAQFPYRAGVKDRMLPEGVLVCNFPNPRTSKGPALMEHDQVVTMFHEFGHLMHHVFGGQQRWIDQSGVATEWDFVEAPSQMFEEWAWSHDVLKSFAVHHETGKQIPIELVEKMRKAHRFGLGTNTLQQMFYASISLNFHKKDPATLNMSHEVDTLQAKYTPFSPVKGTSLHTNFGHLNGYSAIYYTYMWSLVIAKDLLTPFKEQGFLNTEWTQKYRDTILAPGGTKNAEDLVKDFLGREYNFDAFADYLNE